MSVQILDSSMGVWLNVFANPGLFQGGLAQNQWHHAKGPNVKPYIRISNRMLWRRPREALGTWNGLFLGGGPGLFSCPTRNPWEQTPCRAQDITETWGGDEQYQVIQATSGNHTVTMAGLNDPVHPEDIAGNSERVVLVQLLSSFSLVKDACCRSAFSAMQF